MSSKSSCNAFNTHFAPEVVASFETSVCGRLLRVAMAACSACSDVWQASRLVAMSSRSVMTSKKSSSLHYPAISELFLGSTLEGDALEHSEGV